MLETNLSILRFLKTYLEIFFGRQSSSNKSGREETEATSKVNNGDPQCRMQISDNTQCKFNLNNYKMVYVVNSDSFMYKELALKRAKEVRILPFPMHALSC